MGIFMKLPISADVRMIEIKKEFLFQKTVVLTLSVTYPEIWLPSNHKAQSRINRNIRREVADYLHYAENVLYKEAVQEYQSALKNGFPFRRFDAVMQYEIPYNYNCYLSTYHDQYQYTGGAHGNTLRFSDTWNLKTGVRLPLSGYFKPGTNYRKLFIDQILLQADENHSDYFEDYRALIVRYFNPNNYFLSPEGFNIYYQQYEIAPYSTGIVVFTIPFEAVGWHPSCR